MSASEPTPRPRPPAIVWTAFAFLLVIGVLGLLGVVALLALSSDGKVVSGAALAVGLTLTLIQCAGYFVSAAFLLRRATWARWLGVAMAGTNIIVSIANSVSVGQFNLIGLLLPGIVLVLLLRRETADWLAKR